MLLSGTLQFSSMQNALANSISVRSLDGRLVRSERTRIGIIEAYIALLRAGDRIPATADVVKLAGCSIRTLYHHFGTHSHLNDAAAAYIQQTGSISITTTGPREARVKTYVEWCAESWERWLPLYFVGRVSGKSGGATRHLQREHQIKTATLNLVFAREFAPLPVARRRDLLLMIEVTTSLET